jgi:lipoprotein-releasing system permease protein
MDFRVYLALRFLAKRKGNFIASIAALVIGIMVILFNSLIFNGVAQGILRDITNYRFGDVVVTKDEGNFGTDGLQIIHYVMTYPYVKGAAPRLSTISWMNSTQEGKINQVYKIPVIGIDPERDPQASTLYTTIKEGSFNVQSGQIILGAGVASDLKATIGTRIDVRMISAEGNGIVKKFTVIGVSKSAGGLAFDNSAIMRIDDVRTMTHRPNQIDQILIKLTDSSFQDDMKAHLLAAYAQQKIKVQTIEEAGRDILAGVRSGIGFINLVGYFGLLSASFAIVTIMMLLVAAKTRDIGIMKSMGAKRADILAIFLLQGLIIGCVSAVVGFIVGTIAGLYLQTVDFSFGNGLSLDIKYDPLFTLTSSLSAVLLGTAAATYPAYRGSRLEPVDAMQRT